MRTTVVPAPGGRACPIALQNGGSSEDGYTPPELGLPRIVKIRMVRPRPTVPATDWRATPTAPEANTTRVPMPTSSQNAPGRQSSTGPTMIAPPMPETKPYGSIAVSRTRVRRRVGFLEPAAMFRADAAR
ncbi:hypothetical protein IFE09_08890 [Streptomyces microflavus]|nr:hypothetical protein IFE09_08890 [Streptomyces microflavus]